MILLLRLRQLTAPHQHDPTMSPLPPLLLEALVCVGSFWLLHMWQWWDQPLFASLLTAVLLGYLPQYFNGLEKKGGDHWPVRSSAGQWGGCPVSCPWLTAYMSSLWHVCVLVL